MGHFKRQVPQHYTKLHRTFPATEVKSVNIMK